VISAIAFTFHCPYLHECWVKALEVGVIAGGAHYLSDRIDHNIGSVNHDEVRAVLRHALFAVCREREKIGLQLDVRGDAELGRSPKFQDVTR
jgi:hypothetical protein